MNIFKTFFLATIILASLTHTSTAQVILSQFDFNSLPLTSATVGPNGTSVNSNAATSGSGIMFATSGTTIGLDLVVPVGTFAPTMQSIDIRFEYARNENDAYLLEMGNLAVYLQAGTLYFDYRVERNRNHNDARSLSYAGYTRTLSGVYKYLRVTYDAATGYGALYVNDTLRASHQGDPGKNIALGNPSTMTIGRILDGSGNNFATLGSVTIWSGISSALPVELTSFSAVKRSDAVQLRWHTITELNNYGFEVQRSFDKKNWEEMDFVPGNGTVNSPRSYSWSDASVLRSGRGNVYYRLRQIDRDGSYEFSSVVEVALEGGNGFAVTQAFPNPFNPSTTFSVRLERDEQVHASVFDAAGREVATLINGELLAAGMHNLSFHADQLPSGIYFAVVRTATQTASIKMVLQK